MHVCMLGPRLIGVYVCSPMKADNIHVCRPGLTYILTDGSIKGCQHTCMLTWFYTYIRNGLGLTLRWKRGSRAQKVPLYLTRSRSPLRACLAVEFHKIGRIIFNDTGNQQFQLVLQQIVFLRTATLCAKGARPS